MTTRAPDRDPDALFEAMVDLYATQTAAQTARAEGELAAVRRATMAALERAPRRRLVRLWPVALALGAAAALVLVLPGDRGARRGAGPLVLSGALAPDGTVDARTGAAVLQYDDGTRLVFRRGARARVVPGRRGSPGQRQVPLEVRLQVRLQVRLDDGSIGVRLPAGAPAALALGPVGLRPEGTTAIDADVAWRARTEVLEIVLRAGALALDGPGAGPPDGPFARLPRALSAGHRLTFDAVAGAGTVVPIGPAAAPAVPPPRLEAAHRAALGATDLAWPGGGVRTSTFGNGPVAPGKIWAPRTITGLHATADGTVFVTSGAASDSDLPTAARVRQGRVLGQLPGFHGPGEPRPGSAVAGNARFVFLAADLELPRSRGDAPRLLRAVRRHGHDGAPAPVPGSTAPDPALVALGEGPPLAALAASDDEVFALDDATRGGITVIDAETLAIKRRLVIAGARAIAAAPDGALWVATAGPPAGVRAFGPDGAPRPGRAIDAESLRAIAHAGGKLLVADGRQVRAYDVADEREPRLVGVVADLGLLARAGGGARPSVRLGAAAIGADAAGHVYVAGNLAGRWAARLGAFDPRGEVAWELGSLVGYEAAAVAPGSDGSEIYTKAARFRLDLDAPGAEAPRWEGWTLDVDAEPDDPRIARADRDAAAIGVCGGQKLLAHFGDRDAPIAVYRFAAGREAAVPAALVGVAPEAGRQGPLRLWRDRDGDGRREAAEEEPLPGAAHGWGWFDESGGAWRVSDRDGLDELPCEGVDAAGVPLYRAAARRHHPMPAPFVALSRFQYSRADDVAYVTGYTAERPNPHGNKGWASIGTELARFDDWGTQPRLRWRLRIGKDGSLGRRPTGFSAAGGRVFVTYLDAPEVHVFDAETGLPLGTLRPDPEIVGTLHTGRVPTPLRAFARADGETLLFVAHPMRAAVALLRVPASWPD